MCFLLSELDEVLKKFMQGPSVPKHYQRVPDTTDKSGENTDVEQPWRRMHSRRTFKMRKGYAVGEVVQFFVTGSTDAVNKLSEFFCKVCRKDWWVLTHGGKITKFPRTSPFCSRSSPSPRDPCLAGARFWRQPASRRWTWKTARVDFASPLLVRDCEYPFREYPIPDASGK